MKKLINYFLSITLTGAMIFFVSCGNDLEFTEKNTFNLDTLMVNPTVNISDNFQLIWQVSIVGFPQFLIDVYLSDDENLDASDLKIAETADTDISTELDQPYVNGINIKMLDAPESGLQVEFSHDQIVWESGAIIQEDLSGKIKYIIGRFHHTPGLQIEVGRTRMAVEVVFK